MKVTICLEGADSSLAIVVIDDLATVGHMRSITEIEQFVENFRIQLLAQMEQQLIQASEAVLARGKIGVKRGLEPCKTKTLHGSYIIDNQRYRLGNGQETSFWIGPIQCLGKNGISNTFKRCALRLSQTWVSGSPSLIRAAGAGAEGEESEAEPLQRQHLRLGKKSGAW